MLWGGKGVITAEGKGLEGGTRTTLTTDRGKKKFGVEKGDHRGLKGRKTL